MLLGIDIGGTQIKAATVDESGSVVKARRAATPGSLPEFRETLGSMVRELLTPRLTIHAAGAGCKGIINPRTSRVDVLPGTLHYLEGQLLAELLGPELPGGTPIATDNDARVAMCGEVAWGAARGIRNAILLTLGTGVGGAILADGKILRGAHGVAGHLGHLTVDPDGPLCMCGNHGCLETLFSARTIESEAYAAIHRGVDSRLLQLKKPSCAEVFELAAHGDKAAAGIVEKATRVLGAAVAGMVHALDPEIVILGGQIAESHAVFETVRREIKWRTHGLLRREVPVVPSGVRDPSGVVGAAALALESAA